MNNFVQEGKMMTYTNSGETAISSGEGVVVGGKLYIATGNIAVDASGELCSEGVVELSKVAGTAFSQGDKLFWDESESELTKIAEGNIPAGVCWEAAGSTETTANVKLGDMGDVGISEAVTPLGTYSNITGSSASAQDAADPTMAEVNTAIDALAGKVDTKLTTLQGKIDSLISAFKASGQMANS